MKCAIVLFFVISGSLMAAEVDNFTHRYDYLEDSYEIIQDEINLRMYKAIDDANRKSSKICDPKQLYKQLRKQFVFWGWSPMEI